MIIASGPYLSPHFVETVSRNRWPVVDAGGAAASGMDGNVLFVDGTRARTEILSRPDARLLTSGEHALSWVTSELPGTDTARAAGLFKDKVAFRSALRPAFPDFEFREIPLEGLQNYTPPQGLYPFVIKPAEGFFSIGVYTVRTPQEWRAARQRLSGEIAEAGRYFPEHMLSQSRLITESFVEGDEFAVDAYYDDRGQPVLLNALHHQFAGADDVSDRLYLSSRRIIETIGPEAAPMLAMLNPAGAIRNFPLHAEFRREPGGRLVPIEVNPMRFGGWCTTGDFAHFAWNFNSYELFMNASRPRWSDVFEGKQETQYGLIVLDNRTGIEGQAIRSFDYNKLLGRFSRPLHLARMDYRKFPLFGFLFTETQPGQEAELDWILKTDLREFVTAG